MKKVYGKPLVSFESFAFSSTIAAGCSDVIGIHSMELSCSSFGTQTTPDAGCAFVNGGAVIFTSDGGICLEPPQEDDEHNLCYHVSTDATRMFMS